MMIAPHFDNAPGIDLATALNQASAGGGSGGGSGGGFGGGSTGGGGSQGGGAIISTPGEGPVRINDFEFVAQLIDLIQASVERDTWETYGGTATMSYLSGNLIIKAPGFLHRQLGSH